MMSINCFAVTCLFDIKLICNDGRCMLYMALNTSSCANGLDRSTRIFSTTNISAYGVVPGFWQSFQHYPQMGCRGVHYVVGAVFKCGPRPGEEAPVFALSRNLFFSLFAFFPHCLIVFATFLGTHRYMTQLTDRTQS